MFRQFRANLFCKDYFQFAITQNTTLGYIYELDITNCLNNIKYLVQQRKNKILKFLVFLLVFYQSNNQLLLI